ncbi:MAG: carboxypeptidase regulatory-like domain-containing protein [Chloroflexi bacterium]|nr:carboxypeptidase regulatory-like domain-containing protein [Chloroflexota bacterium]
MNKQLEFDTKPTLDWSRYLVLAFLVGSVMAVMLLAFTAVPRTQAELAGAGGASICGTKFNDLNGNGAWDNPPEQGLPGWTIQLSGGVGTVLSATTNVNGLYCFDNLPDGPYVVQEINQLGWQQTFPLDPIGGPGVHNVIITNGQPRDGLDFGNREELGNSGIWGKKFYDVDNNGQWDVGEPGLPGWVIQLVGDNSTTLTTTTDATGTYWFTGIATGTYTITEQLKPGWTQTFPLPPGNHVVLFVPPQVIGNLNFGNYIQPGEIHGQKFFDADGDGLQDPGENGLPNWTIQVQSNNVVTSTTTDNQGNYWFMNLPPGSYVVSEVQPPPIWNGQQMIQWVQTAPVTGTYTLQLDPGEVITDADFGNWQGGKNDFCMIPWDNHFLNTTSLLTEIYIFNTSTTAQKGYTVQLVGPTTFNVLTQLPISLNPFQYGVVQINVDYPSMFTGPSQSTVFQAVVTNLDTGTSFTCQAALWSFSPIWWTSPNVNSGLSGGIPFGFTQNISFTVQNNSVRSTHGLNGGGDATYRVWAMTRGMEPTPAVSLNGLPPGVAITGTIANTPGETHIPISVQYTEFVLLGPTDIILEMDVTGDGEVDMVTSYLFYIEPPRLFLPVVVKP